MLGVMARRVVATLLIDDDGLYPPGRLDAVRVNGMYYIFKRTDGTRRSSLNLPVPANTTPPPAEPGLNRIADRTWFLYQGPGTSRFLTADYISEPANLRVPTPEEQTESELDRKSVV